MDIEEIKKFAAIEEGKEQELESYLRGKTVTPEGVSQFLESDDGKKLIQPLLDKYHAKGLESWKEKNLPKIEEEIQRKLNPEETPEQKKLRELEDKLSQSEAERKRERLRNKAISVVTEKGLNNAMDIVDHFLGQDEDATVANLNKLEKFVQKVVEQNTEALFKEGGRDPHKKKQSAKTQVEELQSQYEKAQTHVERVALKRRMAELQKE